MKAELKNAIENYQCPGCILGSNTSCFEKGYGDGCGKHHAGTYIGMIGKIFLGMPVGFNRLGIAEETELRIWDGFDNNYDKFNVPVWKYLNKSGHTIVRGIQPRTNVPFIDVFLTDCMDNIDCITISDDDIQNMD